MVDIRYARSGDVEVLIRPQIVAGADAPPASTTCEHAATATARDAPFCDH